MEKYNTFVFPIIRTDFIERALETLYEYTEPNFYVYVIDQSPSGIYNKIKERTHLYIRPYRNLGFAKAANTGIRLADTKYITVCNDDVEFINKKWWSGILETFKKYGEKVLAVNPMSPKIAAWGYGYPDHYHKEFIELLPYKRKYTEKDYEFLLKGDFSNIKDLPTTFPRHQSGVIDAFAAWCSVFKRTSFEKIGYFHERFYPGGGEDYDLNARAYSKGYRFLCTPLSWVYHHWSKSKGPGRGENTPKEVRDLIDPKRCWNKLGELWPKELNEGHEFDVWGFYTHKGVRKPLKRAKVEDFVPL